MAKKIVIIGLISIIGIAFFCLTYFWLQNQVRNGNSVIIKTKSVVFPSTDELNKCFHKISQTMHIKKSEIHGQDNKFYIDSNNHLYGIIYVEINDIGIEYKIAALIRNMKNGDEDLINNEINYLFDSTNRICKISHQ
jgi:Na+-translocating ferredoxin:NAD+ oxidoreductase RnfG subunit